jgi:hypothetical protein
MNKLVVLSALMVAIISAMGTVSAEQTIIDLIADGGNECLVIGTVTVSNDTDNIYVSYMTTNDWLMDETHLHIAALEADIPQTKKGNPRPGQFDYSNEHEPCVDKFTYVIPLSGLTSGDEVYIAAHAAVQLFEGYDSDGNEIFTYESAWGKGENFPGKNWAMYFTYTIA